MTRYGIMLCAVVGATFFLCGCGKSTESPSKFKAEYRMQVNVGPRAAWGMGAAKYAELVAEKTGGRIRVKPYYNSELLRGAQLLAAQMVARGNVDCALESTINISPVVPSLNVFALPFVLRTYERVDRLQQGQNAGWTGESCGDSVAFANLRISSLRNALELRLRSVGSVLVQARVGCVSPRRTGGYPRCRGRSLRFSKGA